jgi:hypothetical protein
MPQHHRRNSSFLVHYPDRKKNGNGHIAPKLYEVSGKRFRLPQHIGVRLPDHWNSVPATTQLDEMPYPVVFHAGDDMRDVAARALMRMRGK